MKIVFRLTILMVIGIAPMVLNAQWEKMYQFSAATYEVKFYDINKGAVLTTSSLMVTTDGGTTFDTAFYRPDILFTNSLNFIDSSSISFLTNNKLFISSDLGTTWDSVMLPQNFDNLIFLNDSVALGKAGNSLLRSNDRGVNWQSLLSGLPSIWYYYEFPHPDTGYVVAGDTIRITYDGGVSWATQLSYPGYTIHFPSDSTWYGVRGASDSLYIVKTIDKGATWTPIFQGSTFLGFSFVRFANKKVGYIGGFGVILGTYDGGDSWLWHHSTFNGNFIGGFGDFFYDIHSLSPDTVFAVELNGALYRTTNGTDSTRQVMSVYATTPLYEPCGIGNLRVNLNFPATDTLVIHFDAMYGTATNGVDFMHIPDSVIFLPGMDTVKVPIVVIDDTLIEGPEFFTVVIHNTLYNDTATFWIHDSVPTPLTYQLHPPERIVCWNTTHTSFTVNMSGGATPYSVTWYDTSGILSQYKNLPNQPLLPYHRTIYMEIIDNAMCSHLLDSVKIYYFDSCKVFIMSSHPAGPVPVGVPVTYTLVHDCPTTDLDNRWVINGQVIYQNTEQITHTWNQTGLNSIGVQVMHTCGQVNDGLVEDVVTTVETLSQTGNLKISQTGNRSWLLTAEGLLQNKLTLKVLDMGGRLVHHHDLNADSGILHHTLHLSHLSPGVYLLNVVSDNGHHRYREKILCW